jgi:VIT1/CCC1 family predicted Fe2+/Mn2+ transporter
MLSIVVSTIAFFVVAFFIKRWLDGMGIPKTMTRNLVVFVAAALVSYGVAFVVDLLSPKASNTKNEGEELIAPLDRQR